MASNPPSIDGSGSNGTLSRNYSLNSNSPRDFDALLQNEKALSEMSMIRRQHSESSRRCDHANTMKELEYFRGQHRAAMNQLEVTTQDSATLRTKCSEFANENQRLELEVKALRAQVAEMDNGNAGTDIYSRGGSSSSARRDDYEQLRKRYDDLLASHSSAITKLEIAQEENNRCNKQCEDLNQERNTLKQQRTKAYTQWEKAVRECNKYRETLTKMQEQYDEAVKEVNQHMAFRMKASKDLKRLTDERNAAMQEYTLIMSERDTVHKEMEKLSDDLNQEYGKNKLLAADNKELLEVKQSLNYQMETLRREIASALHDRDKALKESNDLREKFGEYNSSKEDSRDMLKNRLDNVISSGENSARKEVSGGGDSRSLAQKQRLDNLDQANLELESLRKSLDKAQTELSEAIQEAEVSKGRRDWAFSERDKIVLERESIRTLCDKLRKERDRAVSELAEALRESDGIKKQRNEACKELKLLKETLESQLEKEAQVNRFGGGLGHNHSHDSAIDSDMQEWETEILDMDLSGLADGDLGFELVGGRDDPHYPNDSGIYVASVTKGSIADGKLRVNDCISRVNNVDCTSVSKRMVIETVRSSLPSAHVVVRRRRTPQWGSQVGSRSSQTTTRTPPGPPSNRNTQWVYTARLAAGGNHGLSLDTGIFINKIIQGSLAAKEGGLAVGDRVLSINNKSMDGLKYSHEALSILNDDRADIISITTLKSSTYNSENPESIVNVFTPVHHYKKVNSCTQTEDLKHFETEFIMDRRYLTPPLCTGTTYKVSKSNSQEKNNSGAWFGKAKEKFDFVRGRRHSKERNRSEEKKIYRNSSPNASTLSNTFEQEQAIAELDSVIDSVDSYPGIMKRPKRRGKELAQEKNGGTWPKTRSNVLQTVTGTIINTRKKDRAPLSSILLDNDHQNHDPRCCQANNRKSTPIPMSIQNVLNRHSAYKSMDSNTHFATFTPVNDKKISDFDRDRDNSNSLEYSINKQSLLEYYSKKNQRDSHLSDNIAMASHNRNYSQLLGPARIAHFPFHPHPHPHVTLPSSQSGESFCFEPSYSFHPHNTSVDINYHHKRPMVPTHNHSPYRDDIISVSYYESGTFPRKKENPRFRVPSNPSVTSKSSAGKVSTGSIERTSERGSPMPTFHVEVLSPGNNANKRNSLPDYCWPQKPSPGELRRVHIDKSVEPLGIQISCLESGGIFVSTVNENSLASQVGLQIGDQLLEVCGINMRSATYQLAASVLRQCGNSITMLVQYSPDKYHELEGSASCSSSQEEDGDGEPTPCNSPKGVRKSHPLSLLPTTHNGGQSTLTRNQIVNQISQPSNVLQRQSSGTRSNEDTKPNQQMHEPRYLHIETHKCSNLGISLVGGNAVGIFIHSVQPESLADNAGLRTGDQILEYNGSDLRNATAEEAAYELAKPADKVVVLAHYNIDRYNDIKDKPGDSLYVRCGFDRSGTELSDSLQLCFNKDDVLYVDNTMFNGVPGHWRAWKLDGEGHRHQCGIIPSKYKVEEELLLRRSSGDLEGRGSTSARRSFFRRKKHQRSGSRDSKELASFSNVSVGWYSDSGTLHEDVSQCSYQRVERLDYPEYRPVLVLGPLAECVVDKLVADFPDQFRRCSNETRHSPQAALDQELADNLIIDYRRKGSYFECITVTAITAICNQNLHCMLDISVSSVEKLHRHQIYPIVLLIKFKSTKQIKEVKDTRYLLDKVSAKAAKEMYEHGLKLEAEYRHRISVVIPAGVNIAYMCTQVKAAIDNEQKKSLWVPC